MTFLVFSACDQQPRMNRSSVLNPQSFNDGNPVNGNPSQGNFGDSATDVGQSVDTFNQESLTEPGFQNCSLNSFKSTALLGNISLCQSTVDPGHIKVKFAKQDLSERTCIIPTHTQPNHNSFYLGSPQCMFHSAGQVLSGHLIKNRNNFQHYPINSVIVMKMSSLDAYFSCMNAVSVFVSQNCPWVSNTTCQYPNPQQVLACQNCISSASQYMHDKCNQFKFQHDYLNFNF